jgi:hypothetical protein
VSVYSLCLFTHLLGFAAISGAVVCDVIVHVVFFRSIRREPAHAPSLVPLMHTLGAVASAGGVLSLTSAVGLLAPLGFAFWSSLWLMVKVALFVLLTLNGMLFASSRKRRVATAALAWAARAGGVEAPFTAAARHDEAASELLRLERHLDVFHASEVLGVLVLLAAAVFKFQ